MIFEKIRERLQKQSEEYKELAESQDSAEYQRMYEVGMQATEEAFEIVNQVEAEYNNVLSNMYYRSDFERRINEVIPMLKTLHLLGTISLIKDLKAENDILRSYLPQPPKGE